jgi:phosphinothricin acetyltransferase
MMAENSPSLGLHRKAGFRDVRISERYGHLDGVWHDMVLLERRSTRAGGDGLPTKTCG